MSEDDIIDALGGTGSVAEHFDVKPQAISNWRKRGIPKGYWADLADLAVAKKVAATVNMATLRSLRPDVRQERAA